MNTPPPATNEDPNKVYFQLLNSSGSYINYGPDGIDRLDVSGSVLFSFVLELLDSTMSSQQFPHLLLMIRFNRYENKLSRNTLSTVRLQYPSKTSLSITSEVRQTVEAI